MITYYDLSIPLRSLLILGLFVEMCFGGYLLPSVLRKRKPAQKVLLLAGILLDGVLMFLYTAEARARLRDLDVPEIAERLSRQPAWIAGTVLVLVLVNLLWLGVKEYKFRTNTITRSSIKEGVDKLNAGLCFYRSGGRVVLANECMNKLCFALTGKDLQNAELFWARLSGGEVKEGVQRLSGGDRPNFRLPDGSVWTFACEALEGLFQLSAANTTQIQTVTDELQEKNSELAALNLRLQKYSENVDELTRAKERLETKAHIHSELGQALLAGRKFLLDEQGGQEPPIQMWQRNIAMLRKEAELKTKAQHWDVLANISAAIGIAIEKTGELPGDARAESLFAQVAAEAMTNAVSHAQAKTLYIALTEDDNYFTVRLHNDGALPTGEITEGGGLSSLRKTVEQAGGTMHVEAVPEFVLRVSIPKERGDLL